MWPVLDRMGAWAQTWLRREITKAENLDPDILMWEFRQLNPMLEETSSERRVVKFHLHGVPVANRFYWLVLEPEENEICIRADSPLDQVSESKEANNERCFEF